MLTLLLLVAGLLAGMLIFLELGRTAGIRQRAKDPEGAEAGVSAIEGAVYGLMGLLIAFTFTGAASRFDTRRQLVVQEANNIGTAYLRLDLLSPGAQAGLREDFRNYVDSRLAVYRKLTTEGREAAKEELARSNKVQSKIWTAAVAACKEIGSPATTSLVLSSLNDMIDITTVRTVAAESHPPDIIYWVLALLVLASSLLAGYGMAKSKARNWIHTLGFVLLLAFTLYVILDLEHPRIGLIRLDAYDRVLVDVRNSMN